MLTLLGIALIIVVAIVAFVGQQPSHSHAISLVDATATAEATATAQAKAKAASTRTTASVAATNTTAPASTPASQTTATPQRYASTHAETSGKASPATGSNASPAAASSSKATPGLITAPITDLSLGVSCQTPPANEYATCLFDDGSGDSLVFYLWIPKNDNPSDQYPSVLLLEGGGETYDPAKTPEENRDTLLNDPYAQVWGPGTPIIPYSPSPTVQQQYPSYVIIPQIKAGDRFVNVPGNTGPYTMSPEPSDSLRMTKELEDRLQQIYPNFDPNRRYITGLSMGGYGTWDAIARWPDYWAAAGPMCGGGDPSKAALLTKLPIWAFHALYDNIVPNAGTTDMIDAIRADGGSPKYTEPDTDDHGAWTWAYQITGKPSTTPGFFAWLFAQHK